MKRIATINVVSRVGFLSMPDSADVVVVGGGLAGLSAAVAASKQGRKVALISKVHPTRSYSVTVQDGVNLGLNGDQSIEGHCHDTVLAGDYLGDQDVVEGVCAEAPELARTLDRMGVPFNRSPEGVPAQVRLPGSSAGRTCFVDDMSGHVLTHVLYEQALGADVTIYKEWLVTALIVESGSCQGVLALDIGSGQVHALPARAVVLAAGGSRRIYRTSTGALQCTADGLALALRAGAPLQDMEMVHFYPAVAKGSRLAVSPLLVGNASTMVNAKGERFLEGSSPRLQEMAFADIVARAIHQEVEGGRGSDGHVSLKTSILPEELKHTYFYTDHILKNQLGLKLPEDTVPVGPAAYCDLGGIATDAQGKTAVSGLYAAGECGSAGFHGATGLDGNFLLTSLVFGRRAGAEAARYAEGSAAPAPRAGVLREEEQRLGELLDREGEPAAQAEIRRELAQTMDENVGLFRDGEGLNAAATKLSELKNRHQALGVQNREPRYNFELVNYLELGNLLDVAEVIAASAQARMESRGFHYRTDFPSRNDQDWLKHTIARRTDSGVTLDSRPVTMARWSPESRQC